MAVTIMIFRLFSLSVALGQAAATFSLNTSGPSWDYTTKDLADTTSQACKDAYSTSINCDETLLKIVASMDPDFNPQSSDLQAMCTTTCSDSLSQYITGVKAACDKDGDLAGIASGSTYVYQAPVATVGEVFQYNYGQSCAQIGSDYCHLTYPTSDDWAQTDFPCSDECAVKFFQNAHEQPGSAYFFSYFALGNQSSYWEDTFAGGWETVVQCGDGGSDVSSVGTSASSTTTDIADSALSTSLISNKAAISKTSTPTAAMTAATPVRSTSETTSTTATSGAARLRASFLFF
ncbi:ADP-ribosylation factor-related protein 1 [Penicillium digitatum]|uniref:Uncharacterized protein n=3 Tax=Penicillium digitatum TaxID=36651 RepID=K9F8Q1_PEND2|nr:hypothetical protein PDIP_03450 [Penicillium digitatum Pd1]EKV04422.1 hypothetical protein PDIG_89180 [Penicillium digitatum PHI26]EKV21754.1 hypothetical protein PDIP_03450 [Penicillium digitatum Pd1]QQK47568.1 ADP-ribosylation factor-related protein 1 [Penicillium digitatum]